ncbi:MAG: PhoU domain-containing protein, partial [Planctomycetaceae bacterium]|nr:PhoU domain-containing protein [Planctomycetaceae bacterium]
TEIAQSIIAADVETDVLFREFFDQTLANEEMFHGRLKVWYDLISLGRSFERIGDLCTNIAEDAIFMFSGEIVRHNLVDTLATDAEIIDG